MLDDILDPLCWDEVLQTLAQRAGFQSVLAHTFSKRSALLGTFTTSNLPEDWAAIDLDTADDNPRYNLAKFVNDQTATVYSDYDVVSRAEAERNDWYQQFGVRGEMFSMLAGPVPTNTVNHYVLSFQRGTNWMTLKKEEQQFIKNVLKAFTPVYEHFELLDRYGMNASVDLLLHLNLACCVLQRDLTIIDASLAFQEFLSKMNGVSQILGRLAFQDVNNTEIVEGLLRKGVTERMSCLSKPFHDGKVCRFTMLPMNSMRSGFSNAAGVLVLEHATFCKSIDFARVKLEFGLTPSETAVFQLICDGHTVDEMTEIRSMGKATVRSQISNILNKVGVRDRSALMSVIPRYFTS